jgi:hypothetical protein
LYSATRSRLLVTIENEIYHALIDSGATTSCISRKAVDQLSLSIVPQAGTLDGFAKSTTVQRIGTTKPLETTFSFLTMIEERPSMVLTAAYEVVDFHEDDPHDFIIGTDLLHLIFPDGQHPSYYLPGDRAATASDSIAAIQVRSVSDARLDTADLDHIAITTVNKSVLTQGLKDMEATMGDEGAGVTPAYELPRRTTLEVPPDSAEEYARQRISLMERLKPLLEINAAITGFCTLDDAKVELQVDPSIPPSKLYRAPYPIPHTLRPLVRAIIERWFTTGRIVYAPKDCPYNNPLVVAPKKDDNGVLTAIRVCLDTRVLNTHLKKKDAFPLPRIKDNLETFMDCVIFGEFDHQEAYLQLELEEASRPLTAFWFEGRQYMFHGCPFGISPLPSIYQRIMSHLFRDLHFTEPYIDNLPFGSRTWEEHYQHAAAILKRCNDANLKVKPKVKLGYASLTILGHHISAEGKGLDPAKLDKVKDWPPPRTGADMASFLGFVGFLCGNVRHFAELTAPLHALKNGAGQIDYEVNPLLLEHFNATKTALLCAPILQYPDIRKAFHLATDASQSGVGGVLFQPSGDEYITPRNIVGIFSHKLTTTEQHYPAYRKELLAVVRALQYFHLYLWGRNDTVLITDHKPLTFMKQSPTLSPALEQWLDILNNYQFEIRYRPGVMHVVPDQLSRMYGQIYSKSPAWGVPTTNDSKALPPDTTTHEGAVLASIADDSTKFEKRALRFNKAVRKITTHVNPDVLPALLGAAGRARSSSAAAQEDDSEGSAESESDGAESQEQQLNLLIELEKRGKKAPHVSRRAKLVQDTHDFGHFGRDAVYNKIYASGFWWPTLRKEVHDVIVNCDACNHFVVTKNGYHPASSITAALPGDHWQIDCSTHMPQSADGHTAILHGIDVFTGFVFLLEPMKNITAESVATVLLKSIALLGPPKILQSDNGGEFANDVIRALTKLMGIAHRTISPYNPRGDGKIERNVGSTTMIIKKMLHGTSKHWPLFCPFAQLSFNDKIASLTGSTAFALFFGRKMNALMDYTLGEPPAPVRLEDWQEHQEKILSLIYPAIRNRVAFLKDEMMARMNQHRRFLTASYPAGSIVMLKDPLRSNKFEPKYVGPYTIVRRAHNGAYVLKDQTGDIFDRHVPIDQLKLISKTPRKADLEDEGNVYEVEKVLEHEGAPGQYRYKVKWKGYPMEESTWVAERNFIEHRSIADYWQQQRLSAAAADASAAAVVPVGAERTARGGRATRRAASRK